MSIAATNNELDLLRTTIERARTEPVWFANTILNVRLDPWQEELLESLADIWRRKQGLPTVYNHKGLNRITIRAMHGPGKTFGAALAAHWFGFCFRCKIPATAPKERQLITRLWPEFRKIRRLADEGYQSLMEPKVGTVVWCGDPDWLMIAETASTPENLAGYHDDYLLFICEEASGIPEEMFPVIEGALSVGRFVAMLMIGNPTNNEGTFYQSHRVKRVARHYYRMHVSLDKTNRPGLHDWVATMEEKYGKESPVVAIRCYGEFAEMGEGQLIPLGWIDRAMGADPMVGTEHGKLRVSVDVADGGEDESVVTVARHYQQHVHVLKQQTFSFPPAESPIRAGDVAVQLFNQYGGVKSKDDIVVDAIGVGAGTAGYLIKKGYIVVQHRGGEASSIPDRYRNRRTQSYIGMRDAFRDSCISIEDKAIPPHEWDDFTAQLCSIKMVFNTERVDDIETKAHMKARGIKSPDRADSLAMQYSTSAPVIGDFADAMHMLTVVEGEAASADW